MACEAEIAEDLQNLGAPGWDRTSNPCLQQFYQRTMIPYKSMFYATRKLQNHG
jgi:hypothetical protein